MPLGSCFPPGLMSLGGGCVTGPGWEPRDAGHGFGAPTSARPTSAFTSDWRGHRNGRAGSHQPAQRLSKIPSLRDPPSGAGLLVLWPSGKGWLAIRASSSPGCAGRRLITPGVNGQGGAP